MGICYEQEVILPGNTSQIVWTATGPEQVVDESRTRKTFYYLFDTTSFFSEVASKFRELKDGENNEIAEDVIINQENERENMPVFTLTGTLIQY